ncbi:MAG: adenosylcobinamide-GDP ribazoletransferase [Colwellia sp.]|nr:adenosylcobinamide-GDP ribazoletransferase [Colwellia sp.]
MLLKQAMLREQWQLILLAISFFTRIPVKHKVDITAKMLNEASRYFALVGLVIGASSALGFYLAISIFPIELAVLFAMSISVLLTGAFHEDGWADVWDGFGGGWTVENKLNIMKDSRLGTYGAAALFFILMIKYQTLFALATTELADKTQANDMLTMLSLLLLGHCLSRVLATSLIAGMPYVSEDSKSKVKPLAQQLSTTSYLILLATGLITIAFTLSFSILWKLIVILFITRWCLKVWFTKQLGGYTGDCLGAAQQLSEVIIYITLLSLTGANL